MILARENIHHMADHFIRYDAGLRVATKKSILLSFSFYERNL